MEFNDGFIRKLCAFKGISVMSLWIIGIADKQKKPKSRVETIKRTTSRNNFPVHGLLLRLLCNFAI